MCSTKSGPPSSPRAMIGTNMSPRCGPLASQVSDHDLVNFTIKDDLVLVRAGETAYGPIIFGKIRIRAIKLDSSGNLIPSEVVKDAHGKIQVEMKDGKIDDDHLGFLFVRIHDPPGGDREYHVPFVAHIRGKRQEGNNNGVYRAIQTNSTPFEFFDD
ncbi:hypothetical protein B0H11DRAFT_880695 [Mycena galericulata]|nr:hypothetical protein B0H11DRAFT_880695 [Mycena galericulata]